MEKIEMGKAWRLESDREIFKAFGYGVGGRPAPGLTTMCVYIKDNGEHIAFFTSWRGSVNSGQPVLE